MPGILDILEEYEAGAPSESGLLDSLDKYEQGQSPLLQAMDQYEQGNPPPDIATAELAPQPQQLPPSQDYFADIGGVESFEPIRAPSVQGTARPPGYQQAQGQVAGEVSEAVRAGLQETPEVLAYKIATGGELEPHELNQWQGWVAGVTSFVASPTTYLSMGLGGVAAKGAVKLFRRQIAKKIAGRAVGGGVTLGGITAARDPLKQKLTTGEVNLGQTAIETGKSALLGAVAAPAGLIPKVGLAAEIGVFGAGGAALEGRMPVLHDFVDASAVIVGIKLANVVGRGLWKAGRGKPLTTEETKAIADIAPEQRVQIAQEAGTRLPRLAEQIARESPERATAITAKTQPNRRDVPELPKAKDRSRLARLLKETQDAQRDRLRQERSEEIGQARQDVEAGKEGRQAEAQEVEAVRTPAEASGFVSLSDLGASAAKGLGKARSLLTRFFTSRGHLPQTVHAKNILRDAEVNSQLKQVQFLLQDFDRAAKKVYGGQRNMTEADVRGLDAVLKGESDIQAIPESLRQPVAAMRDHIDALSQSLIDVGAIEGKLAGAVAENIGFYATRSYRAFDDPKWAESVPQEVRNKAKALVRSEYPDKTEEQVAGAIENLLYEGKAADSPMALLSRTQLGSKDLSILQKRKTIPVEIRDLWGEYHDARVNYARSVTKMAHLVANHRFLSEARTAGTGQFFFEQPVVNERGEFKVRIAKEPSQLMWPLDGLYTTPEIKAAFERAMEPRAHGTLFRTYMKANGLVKFNKTILSQMTHIRNELSNAGFAIANGHWRVWHAGRAVKTTLASLGALRGQEWRNEFRRLQELGVVNESARAGELRDVIRDATELDIQDFADKSAMRLARKAARGATELYRAEDDVWKLHAFYNEVARYGRSLPELPKTQIEQMAAEIVRNTYPTYSLVPEGIRAIRRSPLVGSFVSFAAEVPRVAYHTLSLTARELADPRLRAIGLERLAGTIVAATGTAALTQASYFLFGWTRDKVEDLRRFLPSWNENSELLALGDSGSLKFRMIDVGYVDPYAGLKKPIMAFMRGENWQSSIHEATVQALEPFLGEEILFERIADVVRNTKKSGGRVYNPEDPFTKQTQDVINHAMPSLEPGFVTSARRIGRGLTGYVTPYGRAYDPKVEAAAAFTGQRIIEVDVPQALSFKASKFKRRLSDAEGGLRKVATRRGAVSDEELSGAYATSERSRQVIFEDTHRDIQAALRSGMSQEAVWRILRASGVSARNARLLLAGDYQPYRPTSRFLGTAAERARALPAEQGADPTEFARRRRLIQAQP